MRPNSRVVWSDVEVEPPGATLPAGECDSPQATVVLDIPVTSWGFPNQIWGSLVGGASLPSASVGMRIFSTGKRNLLLRFLS